MNKTIGIITYHSAYNFGSVLQALATQKAVEKLGYAPSMINYRMEQQIKFYQPLYRSNLGVKTAIKDLMQIPVHAQRALRRDRFETFFQDFLTLTEETPDPEEAIRLMQKFPRMISGSDQIWNKHSNELENNDWSYMAPYLLKGYTGKKLSYASSIANMTDPELDLIKPDLQMFSNIAMREHRSAKKIGQLLGRRVSTVLDPSFLLEKKEWEQIFSLQAATEEPFILFYSLQGIKTNHRLFPILEELARKRNCRVKVVTPFSYWPLPKDTFDDCSDFGPVEFLKSLSQAESVITDSYHGTIFSVNFEKDFYSICRNEGSAFRKIDILERLNLEDRIISEESELFYKHNEIDYRQVRMRLDAMRNDSILYLQQAIADKN